MSDEGRSRKAAYDSIEGDKVSWETFKRLYVSLGLEKAKEKAVFLAKKQKNGSKNIPFEIEKATEN